MTLIHQNASRSALDFFRRYVFAIWFFIILVKDLPALAYLPRESFYPAGFLIKFLPQFVQDGLLLPAVLWAIKITILAGCFSIVFRKWNVFSAILTCLLLTVYQGINRGFGHVSHGESGLLFSGVLLAAFAIADRLVKRDGEGMTPEGINLNGVTLLGVLFFFMFSYSLIGIYRLAASGIDIYTTPTLVHSMLRTSREARLLGFDFTYLLYEWPWLRKMLEAGFPVVTLFEIFAPFVIVSKRFRVLFLLAMTGFHVACLLLMKIFFWENLLLYILLFDFSKWFENKKTVLPNRA